MRSWVAGLAAAVLLSDVATRANADVILIDPTTRNGSFEQPVVTDWEYGLGDPWNRASTVPYATEREASSPDGFQEAVIGFGGVDFWQDVPHTWLPDTVYTLSAYGRGLWDYTPQSLILHLEGTRSDNTYVDATSVITNTVTDWQTFAPVKINTNLPQYIGLVGTSFMRVRIEATNMTSIDPPSGQFRVDDIVLSYSPIPEPSTLVTFTGLLGIGLVGYWRKQRRSQHGRAER
jgi:hypothetical protein